MNLKGLHRILVVLLWVAATHHCILEDAAYWWAGNQSQGSSSDCSSHPDSSTDSHSEGQPCGSALTSDTAKPAHVVAAKTLSDTPVFYGRKHNLALAVVPSVAIRKALVTVRAHSLTDLLSHCLSLAPNAPPTSLV